MVQEHPKTRIRDAARAIGVSEGQLVAACAGPHVIYLQASFHVFLQRMPSLGKVMVLTRKVDWSSLGRKEEIQ